jgi:hypothetical protein
MVRVCRRQLRRGSQSLWGRTDIVYPVILALGSNVQLVTATDFGGTEPCVRSTTELAGQQIMVGSQIA